MGASVPFEVKRVVEAFAAERAEVSLDVTVALDVSTQHPLLWKRLPAHAASELVICRLLACIDEKQEKIGYR